MRGEERAAELGTSHRFGHGDEQRHVFGFATRHDGVDGYVPSGDVAVRTGHDNHCLVPSVIAVLEVTVRFLVSGRHERQTVRPLHGDEERVDLMDVTPEHIVAQVTVVGVLGGVYLRLRDRCSESGKDLRPSHIAGVVNQLLLGVRGKSTRVLGGTQDSYTVVVRRVFGLVGETRSCHHDCRDAEVLCRDGGTCLFGRTDATTTVTADDYIYVIINQFLFESLRLLAVDTHTCVRTCITHHIGQKNGHVLVVLLDDAFEFGVRDVRHETDTDDSNRLVVESRQTRRLVDMRDHATSDRRDHGVITELIFRRVASRVADDTTERRKADGDYRHKEKDSLHYYCFYFVFCL